MIFATLRRLEAQVRRLGFAPLVENGSFHRKHVRDIDLGLNTYLCVDCRNAVRNDENTCPFGVES